MGSCENIKKFESLCTYYNGLYLTAYDYENIKVDEKIIILTHLPASSALAATVF